MRRTVVYLLPCTMLIWNMGSMWAIVLAVNVAFEDVLYCVDDEMRSVEETRMPATSCGFDC